MTDFFVPSLVEELGTAFADGKVVKAQSGGLVAGDVPATPLVDTRDNILATSPATVRLALATDTRRVYFADGTNWNETPIEWATRTSSPDMGYTQNSSRAGYGQDYVTDKLLANCQVGSNAKTTLLDGDVRISNGAFQVYLSGVWNTIVCGFRLREVGGTYVFEHQPIVGGDWIEINSGNGETLGLNGLPLIQQYAISMGAYPVPLQLDGGAF